MQSVAAVVSANVHNTIGVGHKYNKYIQICKVYYRCILVFVMFIFYNLY